MNFDYTPEQQQLADSVRRALADHHDFGQRTALLREPGPLHEPTWRLFAQLGLTALVVPQAQGGLDGTASDLFAVLREFGRALVVEPYVVSCVLGATAVRLGGSAHQRDRWLPAVAAGSVRLAWAGDVEAVAMPPSLEAVTALPAGAGWVLNGLKTAVPHAAAAHQLVVTARIVGEDRPALFLVDAQQPGIERREHRLIDGTRAADLQFQAATAWSLGGPDAATPDAAGITAAVERLGTAAACAEMLGVMELAWSLACEYVNTRQQFGRTVGSNQAVRHRVADMRVGLEMATSAAMLAAIAVDEPDTVADPAADVAGAKLLLGRHGRKLCEDAIQLHGGVGMTEALAVGHCLRRLLVLDQSFGGTEVQLRRLFDSLATHGASALHP